MSSIRNSVAIVLLLTSVTTGQAQVNCQGLSEAQCRMVTIVGTCALGGSGYVVEEGRVTINGKVVGRVNATGKVVDENGRVITELTKAYTKSCKQ